MTYEDFNKLLDFLISQEKKFDKNSIKQLDYDDLILACIGNADKAKCDHNIVDSEKLRRLQNCLDVPIEKFKEVSECDEMTYDLFCLKADKENLSIDWNSAPKWIQLYHTMKVFYDLPSTIMFWDQKIIPGKSENIEMTLYDLLQERIPEVKKENIVPGNWTKAVEQNLSDYLNNDEITSRIMIRGRSIFGLDLIDGYEGSTKELFHQILSPQMQLQAATKYENNPKIIIKRRYFLAKHPLEK